MSRRTLARVAFGASAVVLVAALAGIVGGTTEPGISERVVEPFGPAPTVEAGGGAIPPASPAPVPAPVPPPGDISAAELVPLPDDLGAAPDPAGSAAPAVPVRSGLLEAIEPTIGAAPVRLVIGGLEIDAPVAPVGYDARRDEMEVPRSPEQVGWYRFSASPGATGSSVLAAHVDFNGEAGAFFDLHEVEKGTEVVVVLDDGSRQRWEVVARRQYGKELLPTDAIFSRQGDPTLALITCGGPFDGRRYQDNVVVFARPVDAPVGDDGPA